MLYTCLGIFLARAIDVTLGTISTINLVKGKKYIAAILAFFEVLLWFIVVKKALNPNVSSFLIPFFYALGYAVGTILGSFISEKFISGIVSIQAIIKEKYEKEIIKQIKSNGYGVSVIEIKDAYTKEKQNMLFIEANKKSIKEITSIIKDIDKNAFITINDAKIFQNKVVK